MKVINKEHTTVPEYVSEFGGVFTCKSDCIEHEVNGYSKLATEGLSDPKYGKLIKMLIRELDIHLDNAYCSIGIDNPVVEGLIKNIVEEIKDFYYK